MRRFAGLYFVAAIVVGTAPPARAQNIGCDPFPEFPLFLKLSAERPGVGGGATRCNNHKLPDAQNSQAASGNCISGAASTAFQPTGNPLTTYGAFNIQGSTQRPSSREFMANFGMISTLGANLDDLSGNGDKATVYAGMIQRPGSGNAWSLNSVIERQAGSIKSTTGYELDLNNNDRNLGEVLGSAGATLRPFSYGLVVTGAAPYRSTGAIEVSGPGVSFIWNRGIVFNNNAVKQASLQDNTVSDISLDIRGGHQYPLDIANAGVVQAAIRLPKPGQIVVGNADTAGARDDSGNVQVIGADSAGNVLLASGGTTLVSLGSTMVPKGTKQDLGAANRPFHGAYLNKLNVTPYTPATSATACAQGTIATDESFIYVCTAPNTWKRTALAGW